MCKPLTLTANLNKKCVRYHDESWRHDFFNPRFSGMGSKLMQAKRNVLSWKSLEHTIYK